MTYESRARIARELALLTLILTSSAVCYFCFLTSIVRLSVAGALTLLVPTFVLTTVASGYGYYRKRLRPGLDGVPTPRESMHAASRFIAVGLAMLLMAAAGAYLVSTGHTLAALATLVAAATLGVALLRRRT